MTIEQYNREKYLHDINNHPRYEEPEEIEDADEIPGPPLPKDTKKLSLDELEPSNDTR